MRIVTWNCCKGQYEQKVPLLDSLAPDIAVVQECAHPGTESDRCLWFGDVRTQGLLVKTGEPYRLSALPPLEGIPKFLIPIGVTGPTNFTLLAVWAKANKPNPYIEGVVRGVQMYRDLISGGPTVIVGDLNSNAIWDGEHPRELNHSSLVSLLDQLGLTSAYHAHFGETHGAESRHTYYHYRHEARPFHIDYCFIPKEWGAPADVEVGTFDAWKAHSDHRPLTVHLKLSGN